ARDGERLVGAHHPGRLTVELHRIGDCVWEIPRQGGMRVPGRIYASEKLMAELRDDPALGQVANVAHLPGIVGHALAMPDIHWGYGFPIGGVAAVDAEEGAISPGGIGFDINCGVRLLRTALAAEALGLAAGGVTVMIHSGSRGLGYQVCDDALRTMGRAMARYGIDMPDRQLACVPLRSPEGQQYFAAMAAAANFAWTNRQVMSGLAERAFAAALGLGPAALRFGLGRRGVLGRAQSPRGVAEEMPVGYKDVADVVDVVDRAGLARRVARLRPLVVVKG